MTTPTEDIVTDPRGGYAGMTIGTADLKGQPVAVLRLTRAAQVRAGKQRLYRIDGQSHWNPATFFRGHAVDLEDRARLFRAAAKLIEAFDAEQSS